LPIPLYERALAWFAQATDQIGVWYRWPLAIAIPTVLGHRAAMRERNLYDTERNPSVLKPQGSSSPRDERAPDGSYNDLGRPWMGMAGARFGRNVPIEATFGEKDPSCTIPIRA
jgi:hypothetical protein